MFSSQSPITAMATTRDPIPRPPSRKHSTHNLHDAPYTTLSSITALNAPARPSLASYVSPSSYRYAAYSPLCTIFEDTALATPALELPLRDDFVADEDVLGAGERARRARGYGDGWPLPMGRVEGRPAMGMAGAWYEDSDEDSSEDSEGESLTFHSARGSPTAEEQEEKSGGQRSVYPLATHADRGEAQIGRGGDGGDARLLGAATAHPGSKVALGPEPTCRPGIPCRRPEGCVRVCGGVRGGVAAVDWGAGAERPKLRPAMVRDVRGGTVELVRSGEVMTRVVVEEREEEGGAPPPPPQKGKNGRRRWKRWWSTWTEGGGRRGWGRRVVVVRSVEGGGGVE